MGKERSDAPRPDKKRKGFSVGPANLPDGLYKRKVTKIKETLIHRAKVKKQYSKTIAASDTASSDPHVQRAQKLFEEAEQERNARRQKALEANAAAAVGDNETLEPSAPPAFHPDRQAVLDAETTKASKVLEERERRKRKPKTSSYQKEEQFAAQQKHDREEREAIAAANRKDREDKIRERDMRKRTLGAKTRTGQVKLGKMSHMLLDKVMAQMGSK